MANVLHSALTGADLHEPKGVAAANGGELYVADGAGSGDWKKIIAGDSFDTNGETLGKILTADGASGADFGVKVWKDIIGIYKPDAGGATAPAVATFISPGVDSYAYSSGDAADFWFHVPHDYAPGTDLYFHTHWGHNGTNVSGTLTWTCNASYAKRKDTLPVSTFSAPTTFSVTTGSLSISNYPQYCHVVTEVQLSSSTPSGSLLNTADIEVDGLICVHLALTTVPTITGGTGVPFLFQADIHYQADHIGTKNKDPDYYS